MAAMCARPSTRGEEPGSNDEIKERKVGRQTAGWAFGGWSQPEVRAYHMGHMETGVLKLEHP